MASVKMLSMDKAKRPTFQKWPVGDRKVTPETVSLLKELGASPDLLQIAQRAADRAAKHA